MRLNNQYFTTSTKENLFENLFRMSGVKKTTILRHNAHGKTASGSYLSDGVGKSLHGGAFSITHTKGQCK
jgi:hypothetical protein